MESKHDYEALTDEMLFLEIPGAAKIVVAFDDRSRTEDKCVLRHPFCHATVGFGIAYCRTLEQHAVRFLAIIAGAGKATFDVLPQ